MTLPVVGAMPLTTNFPRRNRFFVLPPGGPDRQQRVQVSAARRKFVGQVDDEVRPRVVVGAADLHVERREVVERLGDAAVGASAARRRPSRAWASAGRGAGLPPAPSSALVPG
jgi:hypothetical protein